METGTVILKREPICIPDTPAELLGEVPKTRRDLAERANQVLGYTPFLQSLGGLKPPKAGVSKLFGQLGIMPFTPESVMTYQRQERKRIRTWKQKWSDVCEMIVAISFLLGLVALISSGIAWLNSVPLGWLVISGGVITSIVSVFAAIVLVHIENAVGDWEWRSVPISKYQQPVPEAALGMAVALKEGWPTAVIEIEHLSWGPRTSDPFLVFKIEEGEFKQRYHIGVWAEPNFQAELR